jgi:hypothetical protein
MEPKVTNANVLHVIKSELCNAERLSTNIFEDAQTAKNIFDNIYHDDKKSLIKGYIQEIRMDKFGMLLYCQKQVNIISILK